MKVPAQEEGWRGGGRRSNKNQLPSCTVPMGDPSEPIWVPGTDPVPLATGG